VVKCETFLRVESLLERWVLLIEEFPEFRQPASSRRNRSCRRRDQLSGRHPLVNSFNSSANRGRAYTVNLGLPVCLEARPQQKRRERMLFRKGAHEDDLGRARGFCLLNERLQHADQYFGRVVAYRCGETQHGNGVRSPRDVKDCSRRNALHSTRYSDPDRVLLRGFWQDS